MEQVGMDAGQPNHGPSSQDGERSRINNRMKGIAKMPMPINPCPRCSIPGCTLRVSCLLIGVIEIVVWVMVLVVVATLLAAVDDALETPGSSRSASLQAKSNAPHSSVEKIVIKSLRKNSPGTRVVKPDYTRDDEHIDSFIVVGAMFVGASITAGLTLILGVLYRAGILCLIHSGFAVFIVSLLLFLVVLEIIAGSFYTLVSSIFLIFPYAYFGICSYALYVQIQSGTDLSKLLKRATVGIEKQRQPGTGTKTTVPSNFMAASSTDAVEEEDT